MRRWMNLWGCGGAEASYLCGHLLGQCLELGAVGVLVCVFKHLVGDPHGAAVHLLDPHIFPDCRMTQTRLEYTPTLLLHKFCLLHHLLFFFCAAAFHLILALFIFSFVCHWLTFSPPVFEFSVYELQTFTSLRHIRFNWCSFYLSFSFYPLSSLCMSWFVSDVYGIFVCYVIWGNLKRTAAARLSFLLFCIFYLRRRRRCSFVYLLTWYLETSIDFHETQRNVTKQETNL